MKILLVYPEYPDTFWSFKHALKFIRRKANNPPLGLLAVAALLPKDWQLRMVDCNVGRLKDRDIAWADYVFLSAMNSQRDAVAILLDRCRRLGAKVVAGGPLFTADPQDYGRIDHLVLGEAEITLPRFLDDLRGGHPRHLYQADGWADMAASPVPLLRLAKLKKYASMSLQYSRGCPYNCDFCDITLLCGRVPRTKTALQVLHELDAIYRTGWREQVFFTDDNFIGNKARLKRDILPVIGRWMAKKRWPFTFMTQASVELADDDELMALMVQAGFDSVFVGIETTDQGSLAECGKLQNRGRDLMASVRRIQQAGLLVTGGFIVGFDHDTGSIFDSQIRFIQQSGITTAMVGLLQALPKTNLYHRLKRENRLTTISSGVNTDFTMNFTPTMNLQDLQSGYKRIVQTIYAPGNYYQRIKTFLRDYRPPRLQQPHLSMDRLFAFVRSIVVLGIWSKERRQYWGLFFWTIFTRPKLFPMAITLAIYGYHFRRIFEC
ncbi:MAG TPA: DUF4070 domain-containing protein [Candidatus Edwardsbacteria bacterium]|nr:DUF4070 domain-containing protein [Candidatus Edwardsbacteria bacterium]